MKKGADANAAAWGGSVSRRYVQAREDAWIQFKAVEASDVGDGRAADVETRLCRGGRRDKRQKQSRSQPCEKPPWVHSQQASMYN